MKHSFLTLLFTFCATSFIFADEWRPGYQAPVKKYVSHSKRVESTVTDISTTQTAQRTEKIERINVKSTIAIKQRQSERATHNLALFAQRRISYQHEVQKLKAKSSGTYRICPGGKCNR